MLFPFQIVPSHVVNVININIFGERAYMFKSFVGKI